MTTSDSVPVGGHPRLSKRVLGAKPSATKEMTRLGNELERAGR